MSSGADRRAKGPAAFAVAGRHVDPGVVKEVFGYFVKFRRKRLVCVQHHRHRFRPVIFRIVGKRQRRVAVPVGNFVNAQPFGFQPVKTVSNVLIVGTHRFGQRFHHLVGNVFRHIAGRHRQFKAAFFIFDRLVFDHHVIDEGKQVGVFFRHPVDLGAGFAAGFRVLVQQQFGNFRVVIGFAVNRILQF